MSYRSPDRPSPAASKAILVRAQALVDGKATQGDIDQRLIRAARRAQQTGPLKMGITEATALWEQLETQRRKFAVAVTDAQNNWKYAEVRLEQTTQELVALLPDEDALARASDEALAQAKQVNKDAKAKEKLLLGRIGQFPSGRQQRTRQAHMELSAGRSIGPVRQAWMNFLGEWDFINVLHNASVLAKKSTQELDACSAAAVLHRDALNTAILKHPAYEEMDGLMRQSKAVFHARRQDLAVAEEKAATAYAEVGRRLKEQWKDPAFQALAKAVAALPTAKAEELSHQIEEAYPSKEEASNRLAALRALPAAPSTGFGLDPLLMGVLWWNVLQSDAPGFLSPLAIGSQGFWDDFSRSTGLSNGGSDPSSGAEVSVAADPVPSTPSFSPSPSPSDDYFSPAYDSSGSSFDTTHGF